MKRLPLVFVATLALFVGRAHGVEFDIVLNPSQEVPAANVAGFSPSGTATIDVNTITGDVSVSGTYTGMTSNVVASHIHGLAPAGVSTGVIFGITNTGGTNGTLGGGGTLSASDLAGLLDGQTYVNIHTGNNGPGEIRGQIVDSDIRVFDISLNVGQEFPAPAIAGFTPSGMATVVVDVSSGDVEVNGTYTGMTSNVVAAHIHGFALPGTNAGVIVPLNVSGGSDGTFSGSGVLDAAGLAGLLDGQTYLNVHTANNGPGEIRGQIPEPASALLLLAGIPALLFCRRRRRHRG